jgi:hypothetical protein
MRLICVLVLAVMFPAGDSSGQELTVQAFGAEQAAIAIPIAIVGQDTAKAGETVTLRLVGTPPIDLGKPLTDQLNWLIGPDQMFVYLVMPGQPMIPLDVEGTIVFASAGATMRPQVSFPVAQAGEYRVICDWNFIPQNQLVEKVVTVDGGPAPRPFPQPQPQPNPDPQPQPPGTKVVMVLEESFTRSPAQAAILGPLEKQVEPLGVSYRLVDRDQASEDNWAGPYKAEVARREIALPALVLAVQPTSPGAPHFVSVEPLPSSLAGVLTSVKKGFGL